MKLLTVRPTYGRAVAAMILSAACWGLATVASKGVLDYVPPFSLLVGQLGASVLFLWCVLLLLGRLPRFDRAARRASLAGLLEPGLAYAFGVYGLTLTSASNTSLIGTTEPLIILVIAWIFLGQRTGIQGVLAILTAMVGVVLVSVFGGEEGLRSSSSILGDGLEVLATGFAALYVIVTSRLVVQFSPVTLAALQQSVGLVFACTVWMVAVGFGAEELPSTLSPFVLLVVILSGIVQYAGAFWFYLYGLQVLPASFAGIFLALIPVFGITGATLFLGEGLSLVQLGGCLLVILAVIWFTRSRPVVQGDAAHTHLKPTEVTYE